jgi:chromosome partitioning protein
VSQPSSGASSPASTAASKTGAPARRPRRPSSKARRPTPPEQPGLARIIAIANQKGGVGKSTTAVSLGASLAELGYRVLVIDLDPQGNASTGLGIRHEARDVTVYDVVVGEHALSEAVVPTQIPTLFAVPSTIDLAGAEIELVSQFSRETRLKKAIDPAREGVYDFILLDCPPSLGLLTINALTAAEELIVPIQCEYYALEGLGQLLRNVNLVQQNINSGLRLSGIVMTMFDPRTKLSEQVVAEVQRFFGELVYDVIIPRTVRLSEAPGYGQPITLYDPKSKGAECYRELAREVALRPPPAGPIPTFEDLPSVVVPAVAQVDVGADLADEEPPDVLRVPTVHELLDESEGEGEPEIVSLERRPAPAHPQVEPVAAPEPAVDSQPAVDSERAVDSEPRAAPVPPPPAIGLAPPDVSPAVRGDDEIWEEADPAQDRRVRPPTSPAPPGHLPERRVVVIDDDADLQRPAEPTGGPRVTDGSGGEPPVDIGATLEDEERDQRRRWRLFRKGGE